MDRPRSKFVAQAIDQFRRSRATIVSRSIRLPAVAMVAIAMWLGATPAVAQTTFNVTVGNDDGTGGTAGTLSWAIGLASTTNNAVISLSTNVNLSGSLLSITANANTFTINGNNFTLSANGYQAFTIQSGTIAINSMTIAGAVAQGGIGTTGFGGGGGGLGGGGAVYAYQGSNVSLQNLLFVNNQAIGGTGGFGDGITNTGGNGGGYNTNANITPSTILQTGGIGTTGNGANGGYGGGGAGAGNSGTLGGTGNGGGNGGVNGVGGNGGLALGGAVFVENGATLTIRGNTGVAASNAAIGGVGGNGTTTNGQNGTGNGGGLYVGIGSTAILNNSSGVINITGDIYSNGNITVTGSGANIVNFSGTTALSSSGSITVATGTLNGNSSSLSGLINNSSNVRFTQNSTGTFNGNIRGVGNVTITGTGTVIFSGTNSYTGGTTVYSGNLQGNATSLQGVIRNHSRVTFDQNFDGTFNGSITSTGGVAVTGTGTVTFAGTNTYSGGTTVSAGNLRGTTANIQGNVANNSQVTFAQSNDGTYAGSMSGTGGVNITGTGTVIFSGTNTYGGGTTVSAGTLRGNTTSVQGNIQNDSFVVLDQNVTGTYAGNMTGTGSLNIIGAGNLEFTGTNSYTGGTTLAGGNLRGSTAAVQGNIANRSIVTFSQGFTGTYAGNMSGSGSVNLTGPGTVIFSGTNSYSGGTTVSSGELRGASNAVQGAIRNDALVTFDENAATGTYSGNMSGAGGVQLTGTGTVVFTGTNAYTGGTTVSAGQLQGNSASIQGNVRDNAIVAFNQTFDGTYSGLMSGTGDLIKSGTGTLTLAGNNTYGGTTTVSGGKLVVNGSNESDVFVLSNGSLGGSGTINGNLAVGGTIAPGNSIGTMHVNGNYTSSSGSTTQIEINNGGNVAGVNNDLISVTGNATLNGGTVAVQTNTSSGYSSNTRYTFLQHTGTRSGTYSGININTPFLNAALDYQAQNVGFILTRSATSYTSVAQTGNQSQIARYLDANSQNAAGDFATVLDQLNLLTSTDARNAFDQMGGAVNATSASLNLQNATYFNMLIERNTGFEGDLGSPRFGNGQPIASDGRSESSDIVFVSNSPSAGTPIVPVFRFGRSRGPVWNAWTTGYGSFDTGSANLGQYGAAGSMLSLYRYLNDVVKVGVFSGYNYVFVPTITPAHSVRNDDIQFGHYVRADDEQSHLLWTQSFGIDNYDSYRNVTFGGINRQARANYDGWQMTQYFEYGRQLPETYLPVECELFYGMQYTYLRTNSFTETGAGALNLNGAGIDASALRSLMGLRARRGFLVRDFDLIAQFHAIWVYDYLNRTQTFNSNMAAVGGAGFSSQGLNLGPNSGIVGGGINWPITQRLSIAGNYDAIVNTNVVFHVGSGNLQFRW